MYTSMIYEQRGQQLVDARAAIGEVAFALAVEIINWGFFSKGGFYGYVGSANFIAADEMVQRLLDGEDPLLVKLTAGSFVE